MKHAWLLFSVAVMQAACTPSAKQGPVQRYRIEVVGSVDCLAKVAVLLREQDIGGYDPPQWQANSTGTASFEPIPAPLLEQAKASVRSANCVTQLRVTKAPARL
jgi:hypothetical protein